MHDLPRLGHRDVVPSVGQDQVSHTSSAVCFIIRLSGLAKVLKMALLERILSSAFATGWEWPSSRGLQRLSGGGFFKTNPHYIPFMYPAVCTVYASVLLNWAAQQFSGIHRAAQDSHFINGEDWDSEELTWYAQGHRVNLWLSWDWIWSICLLLPWFWAIQLNQLNHH